MSSATELLKTFRASRKQFRGRTKTVRLPVGITVRVHPGILFALPRNPHHSNTNPASANAADEGSGTVELAVTPVYSTNNAVGVKGELYTSKSIVFKPGFNAIDEPLMLKPVRAVKFD